MPSSSKKMYVHREPAFCYLLSNVSWKLEIDRKIVHIITSFTFILLLNVPVNLTLKFSMLFKLNYSISYFSELRWKKLFAGSQVEHVFCGGFFTVQSKQANFQSFPKSTKLT